MWRSFALCFLTVTALLLLLAPDSTAQSLQGCLPSLYHLLPSSSYQEGCFAPCMCPVMFTGELWGRLVLMPAGWQDGFELYTVPHVKWRLEIWSGWQVVTGSGSYRIDRQAGLHQLDLELQVGDQPPQQFHSGLVEISSYTPVLDILISVNDLFCYDYVFDIQAAPLPGEPILDTNPRMDASLQRKPGPSPRATPAPSGWGTLKARFGQSPR